MSTVAIIAEPGSWILKCLEESLDAMYDVIEVTNNMLDDDCSLLINGINSDLRKKNYEYVINTLLHDNDFNVCPSKFINSNVITGSIAETTNNKDQVLIHLSNDKVYNSNKNELKNESMAEQCPTKLAEDIVQVYNPQSIILRLSTTNPLDFDYSTKIQEEFDSLLRGALSNTRMIGYDYTASTSKSYTRTRTVAKAIAHIVDNELNKYGVYNLSASPITHGVKNFKENCIGSIIDKMCIDINPEFLATNDLDKVEHFKVSNYVNDLYDDSDADWASDKTESLVLDTTKFSQAFSYSLPSVLEEFFLSLAEYHKLDKVKELVTTYPSALVRIKEVCMDQYDYGKMNVIDIIERHQYQELFDISVSDEEYAERLEFIVKSYTLYS